jgi:hypothetical protein
MKILIATSRQPTDSLAFFAAVREAAASEELTIPAFLFVRGPGCFNLAFEAIGTDEAAERFANMATMALMPARWSTMVAGNELPDVDTVDI